MGNPGQFSPRNDSDVIRRIENIERAFKELSAANPFATMGIRPMPDGLIVEGYQTVNGPLEVNGTASFSGDTTIGGNAAITGTLSLPAGIINNEALANPLEMRAIYGDADGFTLTPAEADYCSTSFTVPSGFTTAMVIATGTVNSYNTNAAADYLWARAYIDANFGRRMFALMAATSGPASLTVNKQLLLTGLTPGQVITCKLRLASQVANVASSQNGASMNAFAFFTR